MPNIASSPSTSPIGGPASTPSAAQQGNTAAAITATKQTKSPSTSPANKRKNGEASASDGKRAVSVSSASLLCPLIPGPSLRSERSVADELQRVAWTADEDAIILDLIQELGKEQLWSKIKEDGRLVHRGNDGIKVHFNSMVGHQLLLCSWALADECRWERSRSRCSSRRRKRWRKCMLDPLAMQLVSYAYNDASRIHFDLISGTKLVSQERMSYREHHAS